MNDIIERDKLHDTLFEQYIATCGWRCTRDLGQSRLPRSHAAEDDEMIEDDDEYGEEVYERERNQNQDSQGLQGGEVAREEGGIRNVEEETRYIQEADPLIPSETSSTSGPNSEEMFEGDIAIGAVYEGSTAYDSDVDFDSDSSEHDDDFENDDGMFEFSGERPTSKLQTLSSENLVPPFRENKFIYEQRNQTPSPKNSWNTSNGKDTGVPINGQDTNVNYDRSVSEEPARSLSNRPQPSSDPMFTLANQPMQRFAQEKILDVRFVDRFLLPSNNFISFMNNLTALYSRNNYNILFLATGSKLEVYNLAEGNELIGHVNLQFLYVTHHQQFNAINYLVPFSINYIKVDRMIVDGKYIDVIGICNDYSQLIVLQVDDLLEKMFTSDTMDENEWRECSRIQNSDGNGLVFDMKSKYNESLLYRSVRPFTKALMLSSSVWCVAFYENYIVTSDNSRRVTIFKVEDNRDLDNLLCMSDELRHNIPSVDIVRSKSDILVVAGTYNKYQNILVFNSRSKLLEIVDGIHLKESVWSVTFLPVESFMPVSSMFELTGDTSQTVDDILRQSEILNVVADPRHSSHVGLAGKFTHLKIPTFCNGECEKIVDNERVQLTRKRELFDRWYLTHQRNSKGELRSGNYDTSILDDTVIISSTTSSVALFTLDQQLNIGTCYSALGHIALNERYDFLNRIYLKVPMLSINAIAFASQAGRVGIFRLTEYCGLYSLRLEWVLIDNEKIEGTVIGLAGDVCGYDNEGNEEWVLVVTLSNMECLKYKISRKGGGKLDILSFV